MLTAGWVCVVLSVLGTLYTCAAATLMRGGARPPAPPPGGAPAVSILKPLHGAEPGLVDNLATFCRQDFSGPVQIVFGVQDPADPAVGAVAALRRRFPAADITLVVDGSCAGTNRKVANLLAMAPAARHDVLVLSDSDIRVGCDYLGHVVAALAAPGVGAATCLYDACPACGVWSRLSAMGIVYQFLPAVVVGLALRLAQPCFGATIAIRRSVLDEIGGFRPFADRLADDHAIGRAVRRLGYRVAIPPVIASHVCAEKSLRALFAHELRWARTIRAVDPAGFVGSGLTHAVVLGLIGAALVGFSWPATAAFAASAVARAALYLRVGRVATPVAGALRLWPAREALSFAVFVAAFCVGTVNWSGRDLRVRSDGTIAACGDQ